MSRYNSVGISFWWGQLKMLRNGNFRSWGNEESSMGMTIFFGNYM